MVDNILESRFIEEENGVYHIKICRGCKTYEDAMNKTSDPEKKKYIHICNISCPFIGDVACPCSTCLVKMICSYRCETLNSYLANKSLPFNDNKK